MTNEPTEKLAPYLEEAAPRVREPCRFCGITGPVCGFTGSDTPPCAIRCPYPLGACAQEAEIGFLAHALADARAEIDALHRDGRCVPVDVSFSGWRNVIVDPPGAVTDSHMPAAGLAISYRVVLRPDTPRATLRAAGGRTVDVIAWANRTDLGPSCPHAAAHERDTEVWAEVLDKERAARREAEATRNVALRACEAAGPLAVAARRWMLARDAADPDAREAADEALLVAVALWHRQVLAGEP